MQNTIKILVDLKKEMYRFDQAQQGDDVILDITLLENGVAKDLTGETVELIYINANNTIASVTGDKVVVSGNNVKITCPRDCTRSYGIAKFQLKIVSTYQVSTFPIALTIVPSVDQNQQISQNISTILEDLTAKNIECGETLDSLKTWISTGNLLNADLESNISTGTLLNTDLESNIATGTQVKTTLGNTINTGDTLNTALGDIISVGNTLDTALKADTEIANTAKINLENVIATADTTTYASQGQMQEVNSQLAEKMNLENQFKIAMDYVKDGVVVLIDDSKGDGAGLVNYEDHYPSKLFNYLKNIIGNTGDMELTVNFASNVGFGKTGTWALNDNGASRNSVILQPGAGIYFDGDLKYVDLIFKRTPTSGKIVVYRAGIIVKTIDCSGVDLDVATSFPSATVETGTAHYTLSCIDAPVEILGLIRLNPKNDKLGNTIFMRCAVSGQDTTYFSTDKVLSDIKKTVNIVGATKKNKLYIIGLGTNDIFSLSKYKSSDSYIANLEKMYTKLKEIDCDSRIIFTIPPISDQTLYPVRMETFNNYKNKLLKLAKKYNASVIDYTYIDFVANNYYQDGVHPNTLGTTAMVDHIIKTISQGILKGDERIISNCNIKATNKTLTNSSVNTISFDSATSDNLGYFNPTLPTLINIPEDGLYMITIGVEFATNATGVRDVWLVDSLSNYFCQYYINATATGTTNITSSFIGYFKKSQTIKLQSKQTSGADLVLNFVNVAITKIS